MKIKEAEKGAPNAELVQLIAELTALLSRIELFGQADQVIHGERLSKIPIDPVH